MILNYLDPFSSSMQFFFFFLLYVLFIWKHFLSATLGWVTDIHAWHNMPKAAVMRTLQIILLFLLDSTLLLKRNFSDGFIETFINAIFRCYCRSVRCWQIQTLMIHWYRRLLTCTRQTRESMRQLQGAGPRSMPWDSLCSFFKDSRSLVWYHVEMKFALSSLPL